MYCHGQTPSSLYSLVQSLNLVPFMDENRSDDGSSNDITNMIVCLSVCVEGGIECDLVQALINVFITQQKENILTVITDERAKELSQKTSKSKKKNQLKTTYVYSFEDLLEVSVEKWKKMEELFQTGISLLSLFTNTPV
jgi:hypothetical protein